MPYSLFSCPKIKQNGSRLCEYHVKSWVFIDGEWLICETVCESTFELLEFIDDLTMSPNRRFQSVETVYFVGLEEEDIDD